MHPISQTVHDLVQQGADGAAISDEIAVACTEYTGQYLAMLRGGHWTLTHAHDVLANRFGIDNLDLMQISGLARAMQIFHSQS